MTADVINDDFAGHRSENNHALGSADSHIPSAILLWRRLRRGMTTEEVRAIFGSPAESSRTATEEAWRYVCGTSVMDLSLVFRGGLLFRWTEPNPSLYMPAVQRSRLQSA